MQGAPFYDAGTSEARGIRKGVLLARRVLRRLLRPMLFQLDTELRAMANRQDQLDHRVKAALAMGWDHVALVRRLAALEDRVEELTARAEREAATASEARPALRYAGRDDHRVDGPRHHATPHSKVS